MNEWRPGLTGVPETMLLTLYHRARETRRPDGLFRDEFAVSFVERIDHDFSKFDDWKMEWSIPVRTWLIDAAVREFLGRNPGGTVVLLGAGLCTRPLRLDNGTARWFSVDLEPIRPFWQSLIGNSPRNSFIARSVRDFAWADAVQASGTGGGAVMLVAEGLFQYFPEADVRETVVAIRRRFPGAELVLDVLGTVTVGNPRLNATITATGSAYDWGLDDCSEMESWSDGIRLLDHWSLLDYCAERQGYLARLPGMFGGKERFDKVVRLRLGTRQPDREIPG